MNTLKKFGRIDYDYRDIGVLWYVLAKGRGSPQEYQEKLTFDFPEKGINENSSL